MKSIGVKRAAILAVIVCSLFSFLNLGGSKDLVASLAALPGLADSPDKGAFVDLVKAMDEVYTEGNIKIEVNPFARSIDNVLTGKADFHIPMMQPANRNAKIPYKFVREKIGTVYFVIYSHIDNPITKEKIKNALAKGGKFPYKIEGAAPLGDLLGFPTIQSNSLEQSFQKITAKRIDGAVYAQEEGDTALKSLKLNKIHRDLWMHCDDMIVVSKGPEGNKMDKLLSGILIKLRKSGKLNQIYSKVHLPYNNWQPDKMGW